jgi:hypothetical protein
MNSQAWQQCLEDGNLFNELRNASFSCCGTELWSHYTNRSKEEKVSLEITERDKEREKAVIIMCLHLQNDSRIKILLR